MESSLEKLFNSLDENFSKNFSICGHREYLKIKTNFTYPDGEYIYVFFQKNKIKEYEHIYLSDLGETLRWLENNCFFSKLTEEQTHDIENTCFENNIEFYRGMLRIEIEIDDYNYLKYYLLNLLNIIMLAITNVIHFTNFK